MRLNLKIRLLMFFFKEMIILLYKRKTRKMQIRPVSNVKRVYNIQGLLYVVTTNFGRERA